MTLQKEYLLANLHLRIKMQKQDGEDAKGMVLQGKRAALRTQESTFWKPKEALSPCNIGSKMILV